MNESAQPRLSAESYDFLTEVIGKKGALTAIDILSDEAKLRFRSFYPCGNLLIGLRYFDPNARRNGFKPGEQRKIVNGRIVSETPGDVHFVEPLIPHHAQHVYGFWHINEQQEMSIRLKLEGGGRLTMLVEGFPEAGRKDRFAWFCLECLEPLYMAEVDMGRVGLGGYYAVQEDAFEVFNNEVSVRTCKRCGAVHPVAYSIFPWKDSREERASREAW